jgi:hypothetical protein
MSEWGVYCILFYVIVPRVRVKVMISGTYWHRKQPALLHCTVLFCTVLPIIVVLRKCSDRTDYRSCPIAML